MLFIGILIALATILGIVFSRLITTFIHELGHAIPALMFTDGEVLMFVGSQGNPKKFKTLKLGRLSIVMSFNIWDLELGLCAHDVENRKTQALIIIFGGPFMSLMIGIILLYGMGFDEYSDGIKFIMSIFMISAIFDFFVNMYPRDLPMVLEDGSEVYNDGRQLLELLKKSNLPEDYYEALEYSKLEQFDLAVPKLQSLINEDKRSKFYFEALMDIFLIQQKIPVFLETFGTYISRFNPGEKYVGKWAEIKIKLHEYDEVVSELTRIIYNGNRYYQLLFQRGKALIELGEYRDALIDFHALTLKDEIDALALANRAYCQHKLEFFDEAKEDILVAIGKNKKENPEIFFLGGLIMQDHMPDQALKFYRKAKSLGYEHHGLDFNISQLEGMD